MSDERTVSDMVRDAVDRGATTAEEIHKVIADLPLNVLEKLEALEGPAREVKRIQDLTIAAGYDLIREINHRISALAAEFLGSHTEAAKQA